VKAQYVFFALFGLLAVCGYFLTWGEWKGPLPPGMGPPEGWSRATLPATYAIDLETGAVRDSSESARDLWWEAKTHTEFCLCPYRLNDRDVLVARVPGKAFAGLEAGAASALQFSEAGFRLGAEDSELVAGLGFIARTGDGNLARVRVLEIGSNRSLTLEWQMLVAAAGVPVVAVAANASLESRRLLAEVRANLRGGKDLERAAVLLDQVLPLADQYAATSIERIDLLNEIGQLYWSARHLDSALAAVTRAGAEISLRNAEAGARPLPWRTVYETYWWLGVLNRDRARYEEAVPWLEKAAAQARGAHC
jgi:tetratricopeptide (TPR) repeat protein